MQVFGKKLLDQKRDQLQGQIVQVRDKADKRFFGEESLAIWKALPAQQLAVQNDADELFYGGAAGGGKTDLGIGLGCTQHFRTLYLRRRFTEVREAINRSHEVYFGHGRYNGQLSSWRMDDGRIIEFGGCEHEHDKQKWKGRPHDLYFFDEIGDFTESQYTFITIWLRTTKVGQRCRIVVAGNPPSTPEGEWVLRRWGPWLDSMHPKPAKPGELRWYAMVEGKEVERENAEPFEHNGETVTPWSRSFLPAFVDDNPYLMATNYPAMLDRLPEPLKSMYKKGDFGAARVDDAWQVIPTAWVRAAQARWTPEPPRGVLAPQSIGTDVARGGAAKTVFAERWGNWIAPLQKHPGRATPDGAEIVRMMQERLARMPAVCRDKVKWQIDAIGVGAGVIEAANLMSFRQYCIPINFAGKAMGMDRANVMTFKNLRAWAYWNLRDELNPDYGATLALPPDPELVADLTAPRWRPSASGAIIEEKQDIHERIGRSPDCGDAVVNACIPIVGLGGVPWVKK